MKGSNGNILSAVSFLDVSTMTREEWIKVGMALKEEGFDCSVWDNWSKNDSHTGEGFTQTQGSNTMPGTAGRGRKGRTVMDARTPSGKRTFLPKRSATYSDGMTLTRRGLKNPELICR